MRQARHSIQGILIHGSFVEILFGITTSSLNANLSPGKETLGNGRPSLGFSIFFVAWKPAALMKQILDYIPPCYLDYLDYIDYV